MPVRSRSWQDREYAKVMNMSLCKQIAAVLGFMIHKLVAWYLSRTARAIAKNIRLMDESGYVIRRDKVARFEKYARNFLLGYLWLAAAAYDTGAKLWKIRPKTLGGNTCSVNSFEIF